MNQDLAKRVSASAFEERYAACADPWRFATSPYENARYRTTLQALSKAHYGAVYEPGCSVGVLTEKLASIATRVIATDLSQSAVKEARARCRGLRNVEIVCDSVATYVAAEPLNLIVFSEIGYYFDVAELSRVGRMLASQLETQGEFVAVHWLGMSEDHVLHGDTVHETLLSQLPLRWLGGNRHEHFRIDSWVKP